MNLREQLVANGASPLAIAWRCDWERIEGAEAMRARVIAGLRRWWGEARRHRQWPGHPHWLECAVAGIDVLELLPAAAKPGADAAPVAGVAGAALATVADGRDQVPREEGVVSVVSEHGSSTPAAPLDGLRHPLDSDAKP